MREEGVTWASLAVSLAGVILVAVFLSLPDAGATTKNPFLIWALFASLCLLGAMATLFPHRCSPSKVLPQDLDPSRFTVVLGIRLYHGHHIPCSHFQEHEHNVRGRFFCAGCTGLLVGALLAVSVSTLHFICGWNFGRVYGYAGLACVVLGLLYIPLRIAPRPILRSLINTLFVLGFALTLSSVGGSGSSAFDLVVIGLCVFWMFTRIQLSRWNHDNICDECGEECWKGKP